MADSTNSGLLIVAGIVVLGVLATGDGGVGSPAPSFNLRETFGHVSLDSYRGHPVLLAFWTTSCGICRHELPILSKVGPEFQRKGIEILAVNLGADGDVNDFLRENHIRLRSAIDDDGATSQAYRVHGVPKLVLIGR